jgi:DNA-binding NarL/FixJ family response regulator
MSEKEQTHDQQAAQVRARIFIVDDHPIVRDGLARLIGTKAKGDLMICGETDNAADAIKTVARVRPDLVMVDISLRGCDGIELTKILRSRHDRLHILVLSMHDELLYAERALHAGANGYIMKNESSENLLRAIRKVLAGGVYVSESVSAEILRRIKREGPGELSSAPASLSDRELEVFSLLGRAHTTRQIADELCLSVKTIETHVSRIKAKLGVESYNELIVRAALWVSGESA